MNDSTTTEPQARTFPDALAEFVSVFSREDLADDLAVRLTCVEVDALAGLLRAFGGDEAADLWITQHSTDDDEGDAHHIAEGE
ncbi:MULTISPECIES: hypothetical protein [unclassified Rathayibacter]|uniref:hypothetical protein n=1 Tax=unclassified Rathayibacter TaxID=2609250 RepID=UPI0010DC0C9B|nr:MULTISPECIES: hypothetical protein [unclassified Rathayibacter]TCL77894.1 hypothetical protein EDF49_11437 [Rathayibacter sp. PhB192]TCM23762.1 hypothetical protein EDF43_11449 [Rathayibacter sp. PhB179]